MSNEYTRRGVLAAALVGGVGGLAATDARDLLELFAPLSGRAWDAADRSLSETVESPHGRASVRIDGDGIPHVTADDEAAAYFAVGYVQAFDRLFQLDLQRRVMRGRLSEVAGEATLDSDEFNVAMDFAGAADATWDAVGETAIAPIVEAYADGVNEAIEREELPLEFELLEYEPEPWTPEDTMLMEKQIAWGLTGNFGELSRALVADRLGDGVAEELYPGRMDHDVPIIRGRESEGSVGGVAADSAPAGVASGPSEGASPGTAPRSVGAELTDWLSRFEFPPGIGSNSWVVSGSQTESGTPIVANDPHLSLSAPPVWYEQHVETPETSVRGVTFPGVPFVVIGANDRGAWGFTNVGADVLDCYTYGIDDDGERYRYRGEWREFDREERDIVVDGGENRTQTVRKTVHGPVLEREDRTVGVAWTGLTATRTTEAIYEYAHSAGLDDVLAATEKFDLPTQNLVYADRDGRTLYYATGRLPIRTIDGERVPGNRIFDGSAGEGEWEGFTPYGESTWDGFVPFEEKPHAIDPDYVATANQRVADDPEHYVGTAYATPYRGRRIYDRLDDRAEGDEPVDRAFVRDLQGDVLDRRAAEFVPDLLEAVDGATDPGGDLEAAASALAEWDYRMDRDSRGALVFAGWLERYREEVFAEEFEAADLDESYYPNDWVLARLPEDSAFFDDRERGRAMRTALEDALAEIDREGWERYGDRNSTRAITHPFGSQASFLNYPELATDGSVATVNNFRVESGVGSSWRMVVEPGETAEAILPGGNSGDYFSDHYDDQLRRWIDGEYKSMDRVAEGAVEIEFAEESA